MSIPVFLGETGQRPLTAKGRYMGPGPIEMVLTLAFVAGLPIAALTLFGWLGLRFVRARELEAVRSRDSTVPLELQRIDDALTSLQTQLEHLQERQDFMERLLHNPETAPRS